MGRTDVSQELQKPLWVLLCERADRDDDFRRRLVSQPKEIVNEFLGGTLPPSVQVEVHEDTATNVNVVLDSTVASRLESLPAEQRGPLGGLVLQACQDESFRQRLASDPHGVVLEETGVQLPPDLRLSLFENGPERVHLVVPAKGGEEGELSDMELEAIAGGRGRSKNCGKGAGNTAMGCLGAVWAFGATTAVSAVGVAGMYAYSYSRDKR